MSWPIDHDKLLELCQECASLDVGLLLRKISGRIVTLSGDKNNLQDLDNNKSSGVAGTLEYSFRSADIHNKGGKLPASTMDFLTTRLLVLLVLVEFGFHYDIFPPAVLHVVLGNTFQNVHENQSLESVVRMKAKKLSLITSKFI